jgi:PKD repeat protein
LAWGLVAALGACGGGNGADLDSRPIKSVRVPAVVGGTVEVSSGESADLLGASLVVPPSALASDTTITLAVGLASIVGPGAEPAGPVAVWGPVGTRFRTQATMTLPYRLPAGRSVRGLFVQVLESDGKRFTIDQPVLTVDTEQRLVRFPVQGFSTFQPGVLASAADADAGAPALDAGTDASAVMDARAVVDPPAVVDARAVVDAPAVADAPAAVDAPQAVTDASVREASSGVNPDVPAACPQPSSPGALPRITDGDFESGQGPWVATSCVTFPTAAGCHGRVLAFGRCVSSTPPVWQLVDVDPSKLSSLRVRMDVRLQRSTYEYDPSGPITLRISTGGPPSYDATLIGQHDFEISPDSIMTEAPRKGPLYVDDESLTGKSVAPVGLWVSFTSQDIKPLLPVDSRMLRIQLSGPWGSVDNIALVSDDASTPAVSFEASPRGTTFPLPVDFVGTCSDADGTCSGYRWNMVFSSPYGLPVPEIAPLGLTTAYTFTPATLPGPPRSLYVVFTADDDKGAARSAVRELFLSPAKSPVVTLDASPKVGAAPVKVKFTYNVTAEGPSTYLFWDFGDPEVYGETYDGRVSDYSVTYSREHVYRSPGNYIAKLIATDETFAGYPPWGRAYAVASVPVRVAGAPLVSITPSPSSGPAPLAIQFAANVLAPYSSIVSYSWDFGDGATADTANPAHTFQQAGNFQVKVTVTNDVGATASGTYVILVQ